jgi:hypothetical protein
MPWAEKVEKWDCTSVVLGPEVVACSAHECEPSCLADRDGKLRILRNQIAVEHSDTQAAMNSNVRYDPILERAGRGVCGHAAGYIPERDISRSNR